MVGLLVSVSASHSGLPRKVFLIIPLLILKDQTFYFVFFLVGQMVSVLVSHWGLPQKVFLFNKNNVPLPVRWLV